MPNNPKILFTVWFANGFHGAVMHISEIAEYLISKGWDVYCVCIIPNKKIKEYFEAKGIKLVTPNKLDYDIEYDIIWNIHFPIFPYLLKKKILFKKLIFNGLSAFLEIESPPIFYENYSAIFAVSEETKDQFVNHYRLPAEKVKVLKNVVPLSYFSGQISHNKGIKKVLIVSNHVPQELSDSVKLFKQRGIKCDIIGEQYRYIPINPQILSQYNVIITIGKTVQYSLSLGIPCYNYDYMSGSGYITKDNIEKEEYYNFSGRSYKTQKTSEQIVSEIIDGYENALKNSAFLKEYAKEQYCVSSQIDPIIDYIMAAPDAKIDSEKYSAVIDQNYFLVDAVCTHYNEIRRLRREKKKPLIKKLFYIKKEAKHKVLTLFGIKFKFRQTDK